MRFNTQISLIWRKFYCKLEQILVRLEFEIKLEPLLLYSPPATPAAAAAAAAPAPATVPLF